MNTLSFIYTFVLCPCLSSLSLERSTGAGELEQKHVLNGRVKEGLLEGEKGFLGSDRLRSIVVSTGLGVRKPWV